MADGRLRVRELERREAEDLLRRNQVGRLAYARDGGVDLAPIGYVYADGQIYGRTSAGTKLAALQHDARVAFEVDEVEGAVNWRSVVMRGRFEPLRPVGSEATMEAWERAVALLSALIPGTLTAEDPVPHRWFVFRIVVEELSGRASEVERGAA